MIFRYRWLGRLSLITAMALLERVLGLPLVTLLLVSLYANRLDQRWRLALILGASWLVAALFMVSIPIAWLAVSLNYFWLVVSHRIRLSKVMRIVIGSVVAGVVISLLGFGQLHWRQFAYGLMAILGWIIWFKRHQFYSK